MKFFYREFYLAGLLVFFSPCVGSALVVDDFRDGALKWSLSGNTSTSTQTALVDALDPSHTVGGKRLVFGSTGDTANLQIVPDPGYFQFDATASWGYFQLMYGSSTDPLDVDLLADGSDAFLITFPEVTPGLWRGSYNFSLATPAGSRTYGLAGDLFALDGPGSIRIPFSYFTGADLRHVTSISLDASRIEPTYRIRLGSIVTVPEPASWLLALMVLLAGLVWRGRCLR